jgi:hypothetical protein
MPADLSPVQVLLVTLAGWINRHPQHVIESLWRRTGPDTGLRWHRQLIAHKWAFTRQRPGRPGIMKVISSLIPRMATENPG